MNDSIPAVVINLDRHQERLAWFMNNANTAHLEVERMAAVDASDPQMLALIEKHKAPDAELSNGEMACILSHRNAWKKLIAGSAPYIAVFEDDLYFSDDVSQLLSLPRIPANIDLIKLETILGKTSISDRDCISFGKRKLCRLLSRHYGAAGYILSRRCAQRLLDLTETCKEPVDVILFDEKSPLWSEFDIYQVSPAVCIQDKFYAELQQRQEKFSSDLESGRVARNKKKRKSLSESLKCRKLRRYFSCVAQGANPFCYRRVIEYKHSHA